MSIYIYTGLPGSGKSTKLAEISQNLLKRNYNLFLKTGIKRQLASNLKFNPEIEKKYSGFITYWEAPLEVVNLRDADLIWDEISTYLDATQWKDLPLEIKRFLQQHRKLGIDIYGSAQDFATIDISMRRLTNEVWVCFKLFGTRDLSATNPKIENPWGLILIRQVDRKSFIKDSTEFNFIPLSFRIILISKKLCEFFDTRQQLIPGKYPPLRHIERTCANPNCTFHKLIHI